MRIAVVLNTTAGGLLGADRASADLAALLEQAGHDAVIEPDDGRCLEARIDAAVACDGAEAVVVGGGDGTIAAAAQKLAGTGTALGIIPLGTMNLLAKDLGIPTSPAGAIAALASGSVREIDVGEVNGRVFLINSVLGMAAKMVRHRESIRGARSFRERLRFIIALLRHLGRYPPVTVTARIGRRRRRIRTRALVVVSNDYEEGFGQVFKRSSVDRGMLTLYAARNLSVLRVLRLGLGMAVGHWRDAPGLTRYEATEFAIESPRPALRVMNDGEVLLLTPPLLYRVRPRALRVIVPGPAATAPAEPRALKEAA